MKHWTRREFVKTSAAGVGAAWGTPLFGRAADRVFKTALVGTGWWGMNILRTALASGRSQVVAMCDVDQNQLGPAVAEIEKLSGRAPTAYRNYRELLQREKPEIVIVATPDHWHPLIMIAAVESGAHVYVEKPIGHTIGEGRAMVSAARRHDRIVQVGTHRRVSPHNISGMEFLKSGRVGRIGMVRAFVYYGSKPEPPTPDSAPPEGLDWDQWCGPGPLVPFNKRIHPRGFRNFLSFANGMLGDWGIHWMDQILWWTEEKSPRKVSSMGGRYVMTDNSDAPDTQVATFEYESFTTVWEHRFYGGNHNENHPYGCYFYGTEGVFHMGWLDGWTFYPRNASDPLVHEAPQLHKPDDQNIPELWADFLRGIDTHSRPACDIEIGHRSTTVSLLGMLALKVGRTVEWDGEKEMIVGDPEAQALLKREYRRPWSYPSI